MLDPDESHSFGEFFLKRFLEEVFKKDEERTYPNHSFDLKDNTKVELRTSTEEGIPDFIFYLSKDNGEKLGCIMESKIREDTEREKQLPKYRELGDKRFGDDKLLIFLTRNGRKPKYEEEGKKDEWVQVSHKEILSLLRESKGLFSKRNEKFDDETEDLLNRFIDYLEVELMDEDITEKCEKLWQDKEAGLKKLVKYRLKQKFGNVLENAMKNKFSSDKRKSRFGNSYSSIRKKEWNPKGKRIYFSVKHEPEKESIAVRIKHERGLCDEEGGLSKDEYEKLENEIIKNTLEEFEKSDSNREFVKTYIDKEIKPENYPFLVNWVIEKLDYLKENCSDIIDEALEKYN